MGIFLIYDIVRRLPYAKIFYSDEGVLPRGYFLEHLGHSWSASLMFINGTIYFTYFYFFIYLILAFLFVLGCKTRLVTFLLWIFTLSLHDRNWDVLNAGDDIVRMYLLIACFLPMGARYSIDNALRVKKDDESQYSSIWVFAYYLQIALIYFTTFLFKTGKEWRVDYTATEYALGLNNFASYIGAFLRDFPGLLKSLTIISIYGELICPILLMFGFIFLRKSHWPKNIASFFGVFFHVGLIFLMTLGSFPFFCVACWLAFVPSEVWNRFLAKKNISTKQELYFDGDCSFCLKMTKIIHEFLMLEKISIKKAQENQKAFAIMTDENSWVLNKKKKFYTGIVVIVELLENSKLPTMFKKFFTLVFSNPLSSFIYKVIAKNRMIASKATTSLTPPREFKKDGILSMSIGLVLIFSLIYWNFKFFSPSIKKNLAIFKHSTRLFHSYQKWSMFSPYPYSHNQWYAMPAEFKDGSKRDIFNYNYQGGEGKPGFQRLAYMNSMVKKYLSNIGKNKKKDRLEQFAKYNCRKFNSNGRNLYSFKIIKYRQRVTLKSMEEAPVSEKVVWDHKCYKL